MGRIVIKLCIFTNHFYPEDFKVNEIAFEFSKKGYEVTIVTAIPDYPQGKFYDGYSWFKRKKELVNGVLVYRLPIIPRGKGGKIRLLLNCVSYFISVMFFTVFSLYRKQYDAVFVHLTSPFFIGLPAVLLKRKQNIPLVFWVLDLWPESLLAAGISNSCILNSQMKLVRYVYDNCDKILIGSSGFRKSISEKGDYDGKLVYFPNWAEDLATPEDASIYQQVEPFANFDEDDFVVLFAGNIGEAQNLGCVLDTAMALKKNRVIKFVFLGAGRRREQLVRKSEEYNLTSTVFFLGRFPLDSMPVFMRRADVLLVSLKDIAIFNLTVPSKLQFYMAQGKPVLAMLNGDGAKLVNEARCGITVPANDAQALLVAIKRLSEMPKDELRCMGKNGKQYYDTNFSRLKRIEQLDMIFSSFKEKLKVCETVAGRNMHIMKHMVSDDLPLFE